MKTKIKSILCVILSFMMGNTYAQDSTASIGNLNKTLNVAKEQMSHEEKMGYLLMAIGFLFVIAVAWFSTSLAKKRRIKMEEISRQRYLNANHNYKHSIHDPYFRGKKVRRTK